jgi:hypothetical protein
MGAVREFLAGLEMALALLRDNRPSVWCHGALYDVRLGSSTSACR